MRFYLSDKRWLLGLLLLGLGNSVQAHTGVSHHSDFFTGLSHPVSGLDHVLAMIAVGLWATQLGNRALWCVPLAFVATMALGGLLGLAGIPLPLVELGIAGSVLILGGLIAFASRLPLAASMVLVGVFALFHGYAHGAERVAGSTALWYSIGFMLTTALLHGAGIGSGLLAQRGVSARLLRLGGAAIAASGMLLLVG